MASSVSSERTFLSAGITISKQRNQLKADIVEALQFLKCLFRRNLIFCEFESSATAVDDGKEDQNDSNHEDSSLPGWDEILDDNDSDSCK